MSGALGRVRVLRRLQWALRVRPRAVPGLLRFGLVSHTHLRVEFERVPDGEPLFLVWPGLSLAQRREVEETAWTAVSSWEHCGFVHGDISTRNILVCVAGLRVWFIDWVLDLESREGTPRFWGGYPRSVTTDQESLRQVFKYLSRHSKRHAAAL